MNIAGPSRASYPGRRSAPRESVGSTYEDDLLGLLGQLSLDEMDEIQTFFVRRTSAGEPLSDHDMAMNDLLQQARALAAFQEDRVLAQRIAAGEDIIDADQTPARTLGLAPNANRIQAVAARNGIQQQRVPAARNSRTNPSKTWGGWITSMVGWAFGSSPQASPASQPNPTNPDPPVRQISNRPTGHDCVICQDPIHGAEIRAPCGHYYDIGCITDLFQSAMRDETLFPPRCCRQNIPIPLVRPHLSRMLLATLQEKQTEFSTLKRVYCSSSACSRFLGPLSEGIFSSKVYTCPAPECARRTCGKCRGQYSEWMHVCRPDADATEVLELSRASGWARCPGCSQMIELNLGCFHMTCRCRTEFCYLCRARWKTCQCPQWDERRLLAVAEERVDAQLGREQGARHAGGRDVPPPVRPPALPRRPIVVRAPPPLPARRQPENPILNRVQPATPGARADAGAPAAQVGWQRPTPIPTVPTPAPVPAPTSSLSRVRLPVPQTPSTATAQHLHLHPTSTRAPTSSNTTGHTTTAMGRPLSMASTNTGTSGLGQASASAQGSTSAPGRRQTSPCVSTSARASASISTLASPSSSTSSSWRHSQTIARSAPIPATKTKTSTVTDTDLHTRRQRMVREMMERLRVDHECNHPRWHYRTGGGRCQSCGHHLPLYLFRCQGCEMLACNRCRRNRL